MAFNPTDPITQNPCFACLLTRQHQTLSNFTWFVKCIDCFGVVAVLLLVDDPADQSHADPECGSRFLKSGRKPWPGAEMMQKAARDELWSYSNYVDEISLGRY